MDNAQEQMGQLAHLFAQKTQDQGYNKPSSSRLVREYVPKAYGDQTGGITPADMGEIVTNEGIE